MVRILARSEDCIYFSNRIRRKWERSFWRHQWMRQDSLCLDVGCLSCCLVFCRAALFSGSVACCVVQTLARGNVSAHGTMLPFPVPHWKTFWNEGWRIWDKLSPVSSKMVSLSTLENPSLSVEQTSFSLPFISRVSKLRCKEGQNHKNQCQW